MPVACEECGDPVEPEELRACSVCGLKMGRCCTHYRNERPLCEGCCEDEDAREDD